MRETTYGDETKKSQKSIKSNRDLYAEMAAHEQHMFSSKAGTDYDEEFYHNLSAKKNARLTALAYDTATLRKNKNTAIQPVLQEKGRS